MASPARVSQPSEDPGHPPGITRWTERMVSLDTPGPIGLRERAALLLLLGVSRAGSIATPLSDSRLAWRELADTVSTFRLFRLSDQLLSRRERRLPLGRLVARLREAGLFPGLWAVEGVGYDRADERPPSPALLGDEVTGSLPVGSLVPLHVGAGLGLARARLEDSALPDEEGQALSALLGDVRRSSGTGCAGVGIEAIGLFVRTLLPDRLPAFDAALREQDADVRAWFWHGVGRALYFLFPRAFFGDSGWARVATEAPQEGALRPARAGFVWALCLVNFGEPAVIEAFLRRHGEELDEEAFRHGLVGTTLVWHAWAGEDDRLRRLLERRPAAADLDWEERVRQPLLQALEEIAPALREDRRVENLFLFQP